MSNSTKLWSILISLFLFSTGCKKELTVEPEFNEQSLRANGSKQDAPVSKQFKMSAKTWYRLSPVAPADLDKMRGQISFANMPGAGSGTATNMGNVGLWFNQTAYSPNGQHPQAGTIAAPLIEAITYSTHGEPLPAVQPDDLRSLATLITWLDLPSTVNGQVIWSVVYNQSGDAVFLSSTTPHLSAVESPTRTSFSGEGIFIGGRGKYANATGTYQVKGYFNPQNANDAGYTIDGELSY